MPNQSLINTPQIIKHNIPFLNKSLPVSVQSLDENNNIIFRSFKVYSQPNTLAKDIRIIDLGHYDAAYKASSYFQITQEFIVDEYISSPPFRTWEHTITYFNQQRQLANREALVLTWTPPTLILEQTTPLTSLNPLNPLTPLQLEEYLQPFTITIGDVYAVSIPSGCEVLTPNFNSNLIKDISLIRVKPLALTPLNFSFRGVEIVTIELPFKTITGNPRLIYPASTTDVPLVPPGINNLDTNFPDPNLIPLNNYATRRATTTSIS